MANIIKDANSAGNVEKHNAKLDQEEISSVWVKTQRIWDFTVEVVYNEMSAVCTNSYNFLFSFIRPNPYGLNPKEIHLADFSKKHAKVVILLHGLKSGPYCFFPLAKELQKQGIRNVYTARLKQTNDNLVPIQPIANKIIEISQKCFEQGADKVEVALIGHSLGALAASKYIWRHEHDVPSVTVNMMVSVAGRLRYVVNKFHWFCQDVKMEIDLTYEGIQKEPDKALLFTLSGENDGLVPPESIHLHDDASKQFVAEGVGHLGVIFSKLGIKKIAEWTSKWTQTK